VEIAMNTRPIVSVKEWEAAREQLRVREKEVMRAHDGLAAERRRMPWLAVDKHYEFDGPQGRASLLDLFARRRQLIVYRAFFEPGVHGWPPMRSFMTVIACSALTSSMAAAMRHWAIPGAGN
jgi:predicted dithiol-disulfide oxidoreductase (DUF899 family)